MSKNLTKIAANTLMVIFRRVDFYKGHTATMPWNFNQFIIGYKYQPILYIPWLSISNPFPMVKYVRKVAFSFLWLRIHLTPLQQCPIQIMNVFTSFGLNTKWVLIILALYAPLSMNYSGYTTMTMTEAYFS